MRLQRGASHFEQISDYVYLIVSHKHRPVWLYSILVYRKILIYWNLWSEILSQYCGLSINTSNISQSDCQASRLQTDWCWIFAVNTVIKKLTYSVNILWGENIQCIQKVFTSLHFFHILFYSSLMLKLFFFSLINLHSIPHHDKAKTECQNFLQIY